MKNRRNAYLKDHPPNGAPMQCDNTTPQNTLEVINNTGVDNRTDNVMTTTSACDTAEVPDKKKHFFAQIELKTIKETPAGGRDDL